MQRIGVLTGGGDCPGLNAAIRSIVLQCLHTEYIVVGISYGWRGFVDDSLDSKKRMRALSREDVSGILTKGGTILKSSRTNPFKVADGIKKLKQNFRKWKLDALIAIGGEDTLGVAYSLFYEERLPVVGIPKTIDNDLHGTDTTIGFSTACDIATEAVDRVHSTAESHDRIIIVEVMGRHTGWIALRSGLAGGADVILIPEFPLKMEEIVKIIQKRHTSGRDFSIVVVAEGYPLDNRLVVQGEEVDAFGHEKLGGVSQRLEELLKKETGFDVRTTVLGHLQRGGIPNAYDRWLATQFGQKAVELVRHNQFGRMASLERSEVVDVELREAGRGSRAVSSKEYEIAKTLFG